MIVANNTPLARDSLSVFINKKNRPKFNSAPILTNLVKTPCAKEILKESLIDSPVPKNSSDKVSPMILAIKPSINPMKMSLFFKFPRI